MDEYVYDAFISYSHKDMKWGRWLQRRLETFHIPRDIVKDQRQHKQLRIFRDQTDLAGTELQTSLRKEMDVSRYLIVICSPASAASRWVNDEIRYFCSIGRRNRIIPLIVSGEPNSDLPELECYPAAFSSAEGEELLGANIQEIGRKKACLKVISTLLDTRMNRLIDRERQRSVRLSLSIAAVSLIAFLVTGALIWNNARVKKENQQLSFDIYGAAIVSIAKKDVIEPGDIAFLETSAEAGNVDAMMLLGDCLMKGAGTEADPEAAFRWYSKAADKGHTPGMVALSNCLVFGTGTAADPEQAFSWSMKAAEAGDLAGMVNVASCYEEGFGVSRDSNQTFQWYQRAAEAGYDLGMYHLARCYRDGIGTEADPGRTFYWMDKLAQSGNPEGMYNLALMYQYAYGTEENPRMAYLWYRKAADSGFADAMRMVGWCIENHYGVDDPALEWYLKAAEAGDPAAKTEIERIESGNGAADGK